MPYKTRCKTSRNGAKVRAMNSGRNFSQQTTRSTPLDPNLMFRGLSYYLGTFGTVCWLQHSVQNGPNWCKSSCHEVVSEFFTTNAPDPPFWTITSCFGAFRTIWVHLAQFVALQHSFPNRPNLCKRLCHEVASEFFATNTLDTPHWTLKLRFGAFHTIWVHSGPFGCLTKLGAKWAELLQKFVPRSRFRIFRNKCTRSTPLDHKLMFWCVSYYLDAFETV